MASIKINDAERDQRSSSYVMQDGRVVKGGSKAIERSETKRVGREKLVSFERDMKRKDAARYNNLLRKAESRASWAQVFTALGAGATAGFAVYTLSGGGRPNFLAVLVYIAGFAAASMVSKTPLEKYFKQRELKKLARKQNFGSAKD